MFTLASVVPWGRSFDEYRRMFALSEDDLEARILGCADGPAGFNAELTAAGGRVVSCDPLYRHSAEEIRRRIDETRGTMLEQTRRNLHEFVWDDRIPDVAALERVRTAAMQRFLDDYEAGRAAGRYVEGQLPALPLADDAFDLCLCSHFLFLYGEQLDEEFHVASLRELCRLAPEVRVFPLLELGGASSRHLPRVQSRLEAAGHRVAVETVDYEFQRGGNQMLRIRR